MVRLLCAIALILVAAGAVEAQGLSPDRPTAEIVVYPGDVIEIAIWREKELGGEFVVDDHGVVTLPMLGPKKVGGLPASHFRDWLLAQYETQLRNPAISITHRRRVYVLGEVNEPGVLTIDPTMKLAGVIAMAGGASAQGDVRRVRVLRAGGSEVHRISNSAELAGFEVRSGDQVYVERRGWFDRNSTFLVSAMLSVASIAISLSR